MTAQRRIPWYYWQIGSLIAFALAGLAGLGEWLGWWDTLGEVLMAVLTVLGLVLGFNGATERSISRLHDDLREVAADMKTTHAILIRIEARLPAPLHHASEGSP